MEKEITQRVRDKYDEKAKSYDKMMGPMDRMMMGKWREILCKNAKGLVLEAGVGTGANFPYYPQGIKVIGVDFSQRMLEIAESKVSQTNIPVELMLADIQELPFADNTFDTIIAACVFCSVPYPIKGFKELGRVLKPEGEIYLLEHVRSKKSVVGTVMDFLNPLTVKYHGVNINRITEANMLEAGLSIVEVKNLLSDIVKLITAKK
ncbi:MAG: methyltransferase type 11 [Desulfitibacter sp. BRH_c19]|nr:MAG: methyltransferase type 11 [Desulfitibacter sp. BRH_c19]